MPQYIFLLVLFFIGGALKTAFAQESAFPATVVQLDTLLNKPSFNLRYVPWYFIAEDSLAFAQPDYDDRHWTRSSKMWLNVDSLPPAQLTGYGWFRLRFQVSDSLKNKILALRLISFGACEVYLDGKKVFYSGKVARLASQEIPKVSAGNYVIPLPLQEKTQHTLAIRFSNHEFLRLQKKYPDYRKRLNMYGSSNHYGVLARMEAEHQSAATRLIIRQTSLYQRELQMMVIGGFYLIMAFLHLAMYGFLAKDRKNLWLGLFLLGISVLISNPINLEITQEENFINTNTFITFCLNIAFVFLLQFVYEAFYPRMPRHAPVFWVLGGLFGMILLQRSLWVISLDFVSNSLYVIFLAEILRVLVIALYRRKPNAWVLGIGLGVLIGYLIVEWVLINLGFDRIWTGLIIVGMFPVLAASLFVARENARTQKDLETQLRQNEQLALEKQQLLENQKTELERQVAERTAQLKEANEELSQTNEELKTTVELVEKERQKSETLLLNILPEETAAELKENGQATPQHYDLVSVLFTDFKGFTKAVEHLKPIDVIQELDFCFNQFDEIIEKYGLERIKTIGDAYMAVGGVPTENTSNPQDAVAAGLEIQAFMNQLKAQREAEGKTAWQCRLGIHSGEVIAGVVGTKKFAYDIWGDTVNLASRMESSGEVGKVNISGATYELVKDQFQCTYRGKIEAKNKGEVAMYFVEAPQPTKWK
ncbi:MAG: hypothetical protein OHK0053_36990 [Microscillaceae bacterium]